MDLPFAYDKVAAGSSIIGRTEEIDHIVSTISDSGKSIALYGPPRCGKETIVSEALDIISKKRSNVIICCIDLFNIRTYSDFIALWKSRMQDCSREVNRNTLLTFDIEVSSIKASKTFDLPQIIAQEASSTMIVYFKDFQNLLTFEDDNFKIDDLEKAWSRQTDVKYIITGSFVNSMKYILEERKLFYSMCRTMTVSPLDKRKVCEYISSTFLNFGRVIEAEETLAIYEISSGNIWYIKQLCTICYSMPAGYVNRKIVNQARDILLSTHTPRFKQTMMDLTTNQINFLKAVIDGVSRFSSSEIMEKYRLNSSANVFRIKDALQKKEVVTIDREDNIEIIDPLFEYWLRNSYFV